MREFNFCQPRNIIIFQYNEADKTVIPDLQFARITNELYLLIGEMQLPSHNLRNLQAGEAWAFPFHNALEKVSRDKNITSEVSNTCSG